MDPSTATNVLAFLRDSTITASESMQDWAWILFGVMFFVSMIFSWGVKATKGEAIDSAWLGEQTIKFVGISIVIGLYFYLSIPWMDTMREAGMSLSGSSAETVDIGEIARQADTVTERVEETIKNLKRLSWREFFGAVPEIIALMVLDWTTHFLYLIIALIAIWLFSKFMLGYLIGGVFIGGLGHRGTFQYGMTAIGYVLFSAMPLFLLAYLQGLSIQLLDAASIEGRPVSIPVLKELVVTQAYLVLLSGVAAVVPREFLGSIVGMSGAPSASNAARSIAQGSNAIHSAAKQIMSMFQRSGGGKSVGSGGSGPSGMNISPPPSVGNAPKMLPPPNIRP